MLEGLRLSLIKAEDSHFLTKSIKSSSKIQARDTIRRLQSSVCMMETSTNNSVSQREVKMVGILLQIVGHTNDILNNSEDNCYILKQFQNYKFYFGYFHYWL